MDKKQSIKELELTIYKSFSGYLCASCLNSHICSRKEKPQCKVCINFARTLINAGYGNIEQILTEFVDKLKYQMELNGYRSLVHNQIIDETLKEFLKKYDKM